MPDGKEKERFEFEHPDGIDYSKPYPHLDERDHRTWALEFAKETVKKEWPEHYDTCDWDNVVIENIEKH